MIHQEARKDAHFIRWIFTPVIGLALVLAQIAVVPWFAVEGAFPDILTAAAVAMGLHFGPFRGLMWGFFLGGLADVLAAHSFGLLALPLALVGYGSGLAHRWVFESRFLVPLATGLGGALGSHILQVLVAWALGLGVDVRVLVWPENILRVVYTMGVSWLFFLLLLTVHHLQRRERLRIAGRT